MVSEENKQAKNKKSDDTFNNLIKEAKSESEYRESYLQGSSRFIGVLRKATDPDSFILVTYHNGTEQFLEIKSKDVIKHDVIRETAEKEKVVQVFVPSDATINIILRMPAMSFMS